METLAFNTTELVFLLATGLLLLLQLGFYTGLYNRIHRRQNAVNKNKEPFSTELPPLSVILCARNEADNLRKVLPAILEQDYPHFEVIVINDASTDETEDLLEAFEEKYPHLYHSFTPNTARYISHKKLSLTLGIKASKYDWLVFTEANCLPSSNQWLRLLARNFTPGTQVVLGYSGYAHEKGWLHHRLSFYNFFHALRYLTFALAGKPYMGVGRNLAYRKELFFEQKGYSSHLNLQRGEDDIFINRVAHGNNTRVETDEQATVHFLAPRRLKDWKEERISYLVTARYLHGWQRYVWGFETTSRLLLATVGTVGIGLGIWWKAWVLVGLLATMLLIRTAVQLVVINRTAKALGENRKFYFSLPLFDWLQPLQSLQFKLCQLLRSKRDFLRK